MLRALKSYWAFTSDLYKWVMLVIVPILLALANSVLAGVWGEADYIFLSGLLVLYAADTMSDVFFMSGLYQKSNGALEFLQSTPRFEETMKGVVLVDTVRRILIYQVPFVTACLCAWENAEQMEWCRRYSYFPLIEILTAILVVFIARHFSGWNHAYICTVIGYVNIVFNYWMLDIIFTGSSAAMNGILNGIFMVCILFASAGTIWYTGKRVRESYYDEGY